MRDWTSVCSDVDIKVRNVIVQDHNVASIHLFYHHHSCAMASVFSEALKKREVKAKAFDADGNEVKVFAFVCGCVRLTNLLPKFDVRGDEDQESKLEETVDLLLAAGYFRARIKGLAPFDKVSQ